MTSEQQSHIRGLHSRHRQNQQITQDCRAVGDIVLLADHLRCSAESHDVLGSHWRCLHHHSHRRDLKLTTVSTAVTKLTLFTGIAGGGREGGARGRKLKNCGA